MIRPFNLALGLDTLALSYNYYSSNLTFHCRLNKLILSEVCWTAFLKYIPQFVAQRNKPAKCLVEYRFNGFGIGPRRSVHCAPLKLRLLVCAFRVHHLPANTGQPSPACHHRPPAQPRQLEHHVSSAIWNPATFTVKPTACYWSL